MKRTLAILLCAALLLSCLPILSAGAKEIGVEQKFKLLLDDIEIAYPHHQANQYYFAELKKTDSWTLIRGGMRDLNQLAKTPDLHYATVGNKLVWSNKNSEPFKSGYGVYDAKSGAFYDLTDAWGRDFSGLRDAWNAMPGDEGDPRECGAQLIGDADSDNEVTILDATRIQRYVAELDDDPFTQTLKKDYYFGYPLYKCTDYDRDGDFTIMDATKVQRHIADLPSILDYKVKWNESEYTPDDLKYREKYIVTDRSQLHEEYPDEKRMLDTYDDSFFTDQMLVGVNILGHMEQYMTTVTGVSIDSDGVLNVDFRSERKIEAITITCHQTACIELSKAFLDDIKDIKINIEVIKNETVYTVIPSVAEQMALPDDLTAKGYTKLTATGIPMSAPSPYSLDLSGSPLKDFGYEKDYVALIRTRSEFERFFPGFDTDGAYDDTFFKDNAIIAVIGMSLGMEGKPEIGIAATKDNTLYIEAGMKYPDYGDTIPTMVPMDVPDWTFRSVDKRLVEKVTAITVWDNKNSSTATVRAEIPWYNYFEIPTDTASEGYQSIDAAEIAVSSPSWDQFDWNNTPLTASQHGYVLLLRSRREFEKYFPGFDKEKKYGDAYFKENAIVAALVQGDDYSSAAYLNTLAVKGTNLYVSAGYTDNYETDEEGTPIAQPVERLVHTFRQVKQSDVASITHISLWTPPSPAYNKDLPFTICDDHPVQGNYSETNVADHITSKWAVSSTLRKLYVDEEGNPVERDDYTFNAENYTDSDFSTSSLIGMRVLQGSSSTKLSVDRVYRSGADELTVDVTRTFDSIELAPDMNWRMIFLRINNYKVGGYSRRFTVKVNVQVVENAGLIAELTPADKRKSESYVISHAFDYNYITATEMESVKNTIVDYSMGDLHLNEENGSDYILLMRDKSEYDLHFGGIKTARNYSVSYFKDNALIAVVGVGNSGDAVAKINSLAVTDAGGMLYSDAQIDYPHPDLLATDNTPLVWTIYQVKKSDVQNVSGIGFWNADSMIREIVPERETMNRIISESGERFRVLDSTAPDIEPKSSQARYDLSYSSLNLPDSELTGGYIMMIKDKATLDRYFPAALFNTEAYTDAYFKDNAIIAMVSEGEEDTARADLNALGIVGERLYVDAGVSYHPYFSSDGMQAEAPSSPMVWAFRQVRKNDISGVKSFAFWNSEATVESIYFRYDIPDPTSENVKDIKTTEITMSAPSESDFSWKPLGSSETGYTLILNSRAALEYYLPGFDTEKKYNDAFFKDSAIIAAVLRGNDATSAAHFGKIGLIYNTLFVNAYYTNNQPVIDGTPVAQPTTPTIWTFAKVSKADIKSIGDIQFWNAK